MTLAATSVRRDERYVRLAVPFFIFMGTMLERSSCKMLDDRAIFDDVAGLRSRSCSSARCLPPPGRGRRLRRGDGDDLASGDVALRYR